MRIHLVEAEDLAAKDNYMKGVIAGMSDPYALLRVGPQTFTSHHIDNTLCPKWGEMYEVRRLENSTDVCSVIFSLFFRMCIHALLVRCVLLPWSTSVSVEGSVGWCFPSWCSVETIAMSVSTLMGRCASQASCPGVCPCVSGHCP